jgi:hypothetical protein
MNSQITVADPLEASYLSQLPLFANVTFVDR